MSICVCAFVGIISAGAGFGFDIKHTHTFFLLNNKNNRTTEDFLVCFFCVSVAEVLFTLVGLCTQKIATDVILEPY